jgi:hypothetical protein
MTPTMARALRVAVVILLGLFGAVQDATEFSLPWNPYSTFGFSSSIDGRINGLQAGSPAAKAGLQDGDRIDVTPLGLHKRRRLIYKTIGPPNGRISFSVIAGGKRRETEPSRQRRQHGRHDRARCILGHRGHPRAAAPVAAHVELLSDRTFGSAGRVDASIPERSSHRDVHVSRQCVGHRRCGGERDLCDALPADTTVARDSPHCRGTCVFRNCAAHLRYGERILADLRLGHARQCCLGRTRQSPHLPGYGGALCHGHCDVWDKPPTVAAARTSSDAMGGARLRSGKLRFRLAPGAWRLLRRGNAACSGKRNAGPYDLHSRERRLRDRQTPGSRHPLLPQPRADLQLRLGDHRWDVRPRRVGRGDVARWPHARHRSGGRDCDGSWSGSLAAPDLRAGRQPRQHGAFQETVPSARIAGTYGRRPSVR